MEIWQEPPLALVRAIGNTKELYELHLGKSPTKRDPWEPSQYTKYWVFHKNHELCGMVSLQPLTDLMLDAHIYILPKHWGSHISLQVAQTTIQQLKSTTTFNVLLTACPAPAEHARNFVQRIGFQAAGVFPRAMTYFDDEVDLHQYFYNLRG
jgi:RimJ/RimL family protein N-acetyltransferase